MDKWKGHVVVVTGASAGIGAAIFTEMARSGLTVAGFARRKARVETLIAENQHLPGKMVAVECDITNEDSVKRAFSWVEENLGGVGVLVNNAGCGRYTKLLADEDNAHLFREVIDTNIYGLLLCTKQAHASMRNHGGYGYIININSVVGHVVPFIKNSTGNIYSGTKHAVTAASEVMRQELIHMKNEKIRVSSVSPGRVTTEFREAGGIPILPPEPEDRNLNAEDVADAVMYLLRTKNHVNITELTIRPVGEPF